MFVLFVGVELNENGNKVSVFEAFYSCEALRILIKRVCLFIPRFCFFLVFGMNLSKVGILMILV